MNNNASSIIQNRVIYRAATNEYVSITTALKELTPVATALLMYLQTFPMGSMLITRKLAEANTTISPHLYYKSMHELIDKGYLVSIDENEWQHTYALKNILMDKIT